jgi:riboflavin transporter FmnP
MGSGPVPYPRTVEVAGAAVFGALAAVASVYLNFVYPLLGWLRFDLGEIPVIFAFLIFGPRAGLTAAFVQWLTLNFIGTFVPIGPAMKFAAVTSTLLGLWLGIRLLHPLLGRPNLTRLISLALAVGLVTRVLIMSLASYLLIVYVAPTFFKIDYIQFARRWLTFTTPEEGLLLILLLTGLFNALHAIISVAPTYSIGRLVKARALARGPWILQRVGGPGR